MEKPFYPKKENSFNDNMLKLNNFFFLTNNLFQSFLLYQQGMLNYLLSFSDNSSRLYNTITNDFIKETIIFWSDYRNSNFFYNKIFSEYFRFIQEIQNIHITKNFYNKTASESDFSDNARNQHLYFSLLEKLHDLYSQCLTETLNNANKPQENYHSLFQAYEIPKENFIIKANLAKVEFIFQQFIDYISPSNSIFSNWLVMEKIIQSNGISLLTGAQQFLADSKKNKNKLFFNSSNNQEFTLGKNLAITPGKVVYENHLFQLIHYAPARSKTYENPILIVTAWINKYYILDLQPHNSMVKWLIDQGYSVFIISWVNPKADLKDVSFADYLEKGMLLAIEKIRQITQEKLINCIGYCLGGTLVASCLSYLAAQKLDYVKSVTFLATLVDFSNCGKVGVFIDETQLQAIEEYTKNNGVLDGEILAVTFMALKTKATIWYSWVENYLLGKQPTSFDILHWNSDSANLPQAMSSYYLRHMYKDNLLVKPNAIKINSIPIDLRKINIPSYILATEQDHIAPWEGVYKATQIYDNTKRFVLTKSGHVAGIVNHPNQNKYGYWVNTKTPVEPKNWLKEAEEKPGSWWIDWLNWMSSNNLGGNKIPALQVVDQGLGDAPGSFVHL